MDLSNAPILSTPAENLFEETIPRTQRPNDASLSVEQLLIQYEIKRTVSEIRAGRWKRIALQFPDDMLVDAPRVFEQLRNQLREARSAHPKNLPSKVVTSDRNDQVDGSKSLNISAQDATEKIVLGTDIDQGAPERLTILGDTSFGACCVDEIAAEHVSAEVVVHYGRSCLSPTARLPVIYVFTSKPTDLNAAISALTAAYPNKKEKLCVMADVPYHHHISEVAKRLRALQYNDVFAPDLIHDPASLLPNRTLPPEVGHRPEALQDYSVFHVGIPPTALLLALSSRVKTISIYNPTSSDASAATDTSSNIVLRRRYASLLKLSSAGIIGILINTLSVQDYLTALDHVRSIISGAGKKSYTFVVGKLNTAKLANFAEVGGWVVIGCWESSLVDSKEFLAPVVTPFELEVALMGDESRIWGQEWIADFRALLKNHRENLIGGVVSSETSAHADDSGNWDDQSEDDEPPEFDLRTGKYVSHSRPMRIQKTSGLLTSTRTAPSSSALVQRAKSDIATVNGSVSPGAEFLRSKRDWQGLGSDHDVAYDRDDEGNIQGAIMEVGRSGVARGYTVGQERSQT